MAQSTATPTKALIALGLVVAVACGCATKPQPQVDMPTHQWVTDLDVSKARYNFDNKHCAAEARVDVGATGKFEPAFIAYERCMEDRGYRLSTYTPARYPGRP